MRAVARQRRGQRGLHGAAGDTGRQALRRALAGGVQHLDEHAGRIHGLHGFVEHQHHAARPRGVQAVCRGAGCREPRALRVHRESAVCGSQRVVGPVHHRAGQAQRVAALLQHAVGPHRGFGGAIHIQHVHCHGHVVACGVQQAHGASGQQRAAVHAFAEAHTQHVGRGARTAVGGGDGLHLRRHRLAAHAAHAVGLQVAVVGGGRLSGHLGGGGPHQAHACCEPFFGGQSQAGAAATTETDAAAQHGACARRAGEGAYRQRQRLEAHHAEVGSQGDVVGAAVTVHVHRDAALEQLRAVAHTQPEAQHVHRAQCQRQGAGLRTGNGDQCRGRARQVRQLARLVAQLEGRIRTQLRLRTDGLGDDAAHVHPCGDAKQPPVAGVEWRVVGGQGGGRAATAATTTNTTTTTPVTAATTAGGEHGQRHVRCSAAKAVQGQRHAGLSCKSGGH